MTYSYCLLCDYSDYYDDDYYAQLLNDTSFMNSTFTDTANSADIFILKEIIIKKPSILEYIMIYWVFSVVVEEVRQVSNYLIHA